MTDGDKKRAAFTVRVSQKMKNIIIQETAKRNALGGQQLTQTDMHNELLEEAMVNRGWLRRDQESH